MRRTSFLLFFAVPLVLAAGCASTDWEARYLEKEQEARALQEDYESLSQQVAEQDVDTDVYAAELVQSRAQLDVLSRELQEMKNAPPPAQVTDSGRAELEAELARLKTKYGKLVKLTPEGNIEITMKSEVTFAAGSYTLTKAGKGVLDSVARELNGEFASNQVRVIGHTDTDPIKKSPFKDNWELGAERALEVIRYLSTQHGIAPGRLVGASRGETAPIADNSTKQGRNENRRVEIVVVIPRVQVIGEFTSQN